MRLIFLGTAAFAAPTTEAVVEAGHEVAVVLTQPDRPSGRGQNASTSPVKQAALRLGLTVYQPERVRRPEAGEGETAAAAPVKRAPPLLGVTVSQPERVRRPEAVEYLRGMASDAMVVVGYGQIIPQVVIDLAPSVSSMYTPRCCPNIAAPDPFNGPLCAARRAR